MRFSGRDREREKEKKKHDGRNLKHQAMPTHKTLRFSSFHPFNLHLKMKQNKI